MYNPLSKDQIGANVFGVLTGHKAYQNGAMPMQAINVGVHWRYWYKNITGSVFAVLALLLFVSPGMAIIQVLVSIFVFGVTYVSLVDMSAGFKQGRWWYRRFVRIQHAMPNVARFYWYFLLLIPFWTFMWVMVLIQKDFQGLWWFSDCEACTR